MLEFPKWKYAAGTGAGVIVQNAEEELALEGEWFDDPWTAQAVGMPEAPAEPESETETETETETEQPEPTKEELIALAEELGVKIDKRWGTASIAEAIAEHQANLE